LAFGSKGLATRSETVPKLGLQLPDVGRVTEDRKNVQSQAMNCEIVSLQGHAILRRTRSIAAEPRYDARGPCSRRVTKRTP